MPRSEEQLELTLFGSEELLLSQATLLSIRRIVNKEFKGMPNRSNYQDMTEALAMAVRIAPVSEDVKQDIVIEAISRLHRTREHTQNMALSHAMHILNYGKH